MQVEFTDISCIGVGGALDYTIIITDSNEEEIGSDNGNIACGESASWDFSINSQSNPIELGDYQATISFTNSGTLVQASWNYRFAVVYEF
jgi:hypothetical protein